MTDKPILFSGPMVRALLAGSKTQTRRTISTKPSMRRPNLFDGSWTDSYVLDPGNQDWRQASLQIKLGDRLYVREHWRTWAQYDGVAPRDLMAGTHVAYEATGGPNLGGNAGRFRQGMHMPRWASRITLHVTEVRVQRLQEISREDALAEGLEHWPEGSPVSGSKYGVMINEHTRCAGESPRDAYQALWQYINGPSSWDANPWVAAYTFTLEHTNIDQASA